MGLLYTFIYIYIYIYIVENIGRKIKPISSRVKPVMHASCTPLTVVEVIQKILTAPGLSSARHEMTDRALY